MSASTIPAPPVPDTLAPSPPKRRRRGGGLGNRPGFLTYGLLGAFAWGLVGWPAFLFMVLVLGLVVLLLMTYDAEEAGPDRAAQPPVTPPAEPSAP